MTDNASAPMPMTLPALIQFALEQGVRQVEAAGSPLHPFLVTSEGTMALLFDAEQRADPMDMAVRALRDDPMLASAQRVAVVLDTRVTPKDRPKTDAILVLACERDAGEGEAWARFYRPKGWFRRFRSDGDAVQVGTAKNLFDVALAPA